MQLAPLTFVSCGCIDAHEIHTEKSARLNLSGGLFAFCMPPAGWFLSSRPLWCGSYWGDNPSNPSKSALTPNPQALLFGFPSSPLVTVPTPWT